MSIYPTEPTLLCIGDVNPDISLPVRESRLEASFSGGGTVANTAVGASRLGVRTSFCGGIGDDLFGSKMVEMLEAEGVDTSYCQRIPGSFSNLVFAVVQPDGQRNIFVWPREKAAQSRLLPCHLPTEQFGLIHFSSITFREEPVCSTILGYITASAGSILSYDLNLRREFFEDSPQFERAVQTSLSMAHIIYGSAEEEFYPLTGIQDPQRACRAISEDACVIARLGKEGLFCQYGQASYYEPAYEVELIDSTGAGDCFDSAFLASLCRGYELSEALKIANAAAALSLQTVGARGCPDWPSLRSFLSQMHPDLRWER